MIRDFLVPAALLALVGSMIFPISPDLMDFLLVLNLIFALTLFVTAISITDSLKLTALPAILLVGTLCRLALNVSSTRLILSTGEAGKVIEAFGKVVIQGNLVVGLVVFLVITLIQFIVVAKGSERVAEVAARFTLDAMPGKQMSIDADMRAGLIDFETARKKRQELQTESRFFGALDGAMKFVKGDAIAGMVIIVVNVIGGLITGVVLHDLSFQVALSRYTVLSVGDGLVAQIPALLSSLAAGMVVTRVSRGTEETLARELLMQLGQLGGVKVLIGFACVVMAVMPGMPALPFLVVSVMLMVSAALRKKSDSKSDESPVVATFKPKTHPLLKIEFAEAALRALKDSGTLVSSLEAFRGESYERHGIILPPPEISVVDRKVGFRVLMRGISVEDLNEECKPEEMGDKLKGSLIELVGRRVVDFVDDVATRRLLDNYEKDASEIVAAVVPGVVTLTQLTTLLKNLLREGVSIRNFDMILQAVLEAGVKGGADRGLLEEVRVGIKRVISATFSHEGAIRCVSLDPETDLMLMKSERGGSVTSPDALSPLVRDLGEMNQDRSIVLVTSKGARKLTQECLQIRSIKIPVLAYDEIDEDYHLECERSVGALSEDIRVEEEEYARAAA